MLGHRARWEAMVALAKGSEDASLIAQQRMRIAKLERQVYGFPVP